MRKIIDYRVETGYTALALAANVSVRTGEGFQPFKSLAMAWIPDTDEQCGRMEYAQAMVRYAPEGE